jgi:hypothetical protein
LPCVPGAARISQVALALHDHWRVRILQAGLSMKGRLPGALRHLAGTIAASVYSRQLQFVTVQPIDVPDGAVGSRWTAPDRQTELMIVDSLGALEAVAPEIPAGFRDSVDELRKRVASGCVLCLARRQRKDRSGREVIGYELTERGVFSALGIRRAVRSEIIFSHWAEVLPAYRGQRIHRLLFATRDAYFQRRGGTVVCGVVAPRNRASLQALGRAGSTIVGTVKRVSLFGGLIAWETPWKRIEGTLHVVGRASRRGAFRTAGSAIRLTDAVRCRVTR